MHTVGKLLHISTAGYTEFATFTNKEVQKLYLENY